MSSLELAATSLLGWRAGQLDRQHVGDRMDEMDGMDGMDGTEGQKLEQNRTGSDTKDAKPPHNKWKSYPDPVLPRRTQN
jgi:hypothetical protein